MRHLPFFHARQTRKTTTRTLNPIHKVSPRATAFAAGVESASTARNSSSVLLTVKSPFVQKYFALPLLRASPPLFAFLCLCSSARICSTPLRIYSYLCLSESSRIRAFAPRCTAVTTCAPAEQTCQHNAVAEFCAHIRAFAKLLQAIQRLCKSYHCRSRSNPIHAMPLLSR